MSEYKVVVMDLNMISVAMDGLTEWAGATRGHERKMAHYLAGYINGKCAELVNSNESDIAVTLSDMQITNILDGITLYRNSGQGWYSWYDLARGELIRRLCYA